MGWDGRYATLSSLGPVFLNFGDGQLGSSTMHAFSRPKLRPSPRGPCRCSLDEIMSTSQTSMVHVGSPVLTSFFDEGLSLGC